MKAACVVDAALDSVARCNPNLNAFTDIVADRARRKAVAVDAARAAGRDPGVMAGVPFVVKNLFDIQGVTTRAGSLINRDNAPAKRDAVVIERLEAVGAILVGATNMGEYAYDFTGENEHDGPSRNPHDMKRMSGGSSGGSGVAVAAGIVPLALGSDTNGSIRIPASWCGLYGLKPTYGRLPRSGTFPFVDSLDHVGSLCRSVSDLALSYDAMQGPDSDDPTCSRRTAEPVYGSLDKGANGLRIAIAGDYFRRGGSPEAHAAVEVCAIALGVTQEAVLHGAAEARSAAYVISATEGAALHFHNLQTKAADFGSPTRERLFAGALLPGVAYVKAQRLRRAFQARAAALFEEVDILLAPATPTTAATLGQTTMMLNGEETLLRPNIGIFTQPISFIGLPVVCVPVRSVADMPIGVQIIAPAFREDLALRVAYTLAEAGVIDASPAVMKGD
jgi:aspartyl-tRNA(Asn)/glutamyl-tRNA(Gln) amidotransferase subunit A